MGKEFDLDKIYTKILSKEEIIKTIERCYDKEFIVSFLPRSPDNADILIRSKQKQFGDCNHNKQIEEKKK